MGKTTKLTTKEFIEKCCKRFGDKYDCSKVNYINSNTKVCIICPEHGEFNIRPYDFLHSMFGCPKCADVYNGKKKAKNKEQFILKAREVHGWKYDYSKVEYKNNSTKVCIICPEHGEFWQTPDSHLNSKAGCPICCGKKKLTTEEFIKRAKEVHGDKYDYSKVEYKNNKTPVTIICPIHGEFLQKPNNHLLGQGCNKCIRNVFDTNSFIKKARKVHSNKYDYSKVQYKRTDEKVCIICPEHGEFWQTPCSHLNKHGCPKCIQWKLEKELSDILIENKIEFQFQKKFEWLGRKTLDFYLPKYNIAIECQGEQHFKPINYFGGKDKFELVEKNDFLKQELCKNNNIIVFYFTNVAIKNVNENIYNKNNFFVDKNELINKLIKKI